MDSESPVEIAIPEMENMLKSKSGASSSSQWVMMGKRFPSSEVKFFSQTIILYIVIITCLANLTIADSDMRSVWISLLCSCLGCILPSPTISSRLQRETGIYSFLLFLG